MDAIMNKLLILFGLLLVLVPSTAPAELISLNPNPPLGEGSESTYQGPFFITWPAQGSGYTCDNINDSSNSGCVAFGDGPDVSYRFYSPLGTGFVDAEICADGPYYSVLNVLIPYRGYGDCSRSAHDLPGCGYYSSSLTNIPITKTDSYYQLLVDGHSFYGGNPNCGNYTLTAHYTPVQLGADGGVGTGGEGGTGGFGGGGGVPCSVQAGSAGSAGQPGNPGNAGGHGSTNRVRVYAAQLHNYSTFSVGGLHGHTGPTGDSGSTGGYGGNGGVVLGGGGAGGEPSPDQDVNYVSGGAAGVWPSGTGGNGSRGGGGGGGGGSSPFVGGGYGAGGGQGDAGNNGSGSDGHNGADKTQWVSLDMALNDPFQIGGNGGDGGQGGQGGHGGGGGGGAGECWGNPAGAGGSGGVGGAGGVGGPGGTSGNGSCYLENGGRFENYAILNIGRGSAGGEGHLRIYDGCSLINKPGAETHFFSNSLFEMMGSEATVLNDGLISHTYSEFENVGIYSGFGRMEGTFHNAGEVSPGNTIGLLTMSGYRESGSLLIQLAGLQSEPLAYDVLVVEAGLTIEPGSILVISFANGFNENDLQLGDSFDIIRYSSGQRSGEYEYLDTTLAPVSNGLWSLVYDQSVDTGSAIQLVYGESLSGANDSDLPGNFALRSIHPNPFNPVTTIEYDLPRSSSVRFSVYDVAGRLVWASGSGVVTPAGRHEIVWRGKDTSGRNLASGSYLLRMQADGFEATRRMVLVR